MCSEVGVTLLLLHPLAQTDIRLRSAPSPSAPAPLPAVAEARTQASEARSFSNSKAVSLSSRKTAIICSKKSGGAGHAKAPHGAGASTNCRHQISTHAKAKMI